MKSIIPGSKRDNIISVQQQGTRFTRILGKYGLQWMLLLVLLSLGIANVNFRQLPNIQNILLQSSFVGIGAAGMTFLMISGAIDLSVAGLLGLCGVALAKIEPRVGIIPAIIIVFIIGAVMGMISGLVVTKIRIPAFIATLGMNYIYLGVAFIWTNGQVISVTKKGFRSLSTGNVVGIPKPFLMMIAIYLLCYGILRFTTYGRYIRAVGSNETASNVAGLPTDRVRIFAFMVVGLCTALAGILLTGMLSSANPIMATGYELNVIAAAVMGGTSLSGGQGTLLGSLTGAIFFTVINNALNMFGVGAYWQYIVVGLILITALAIKAIHKSL